MVRNVNISNLCQTDSPDRPSSEQEEETPIVLFQNPEDKENLTIMPTRHNLDPKNHSLYDDRHTESTPANLAKPFVIMAQQQADSQPLTQPTGKSIFEKPPAKFDPMSQDPFNQFELV